MKICVLVNGKKELPAWELAMLKELVSAGTVSIQAFIVNDRIQYPNENFVLKLFRKFENKWFRSLPDVFEVFPVADDFAHLPVLELNNPEAVKTFEADLIYCSCLTSFTDALLNYTKYGIWQVQFGTAKYLDSYPLAYWEVMDDTPTIGSRLVAYLPGKGNPVNVYEGNTITVPYSVKNTLITLGWKSSSYLVTRLREFSITDPGHFFQHYESKHKAPQKTNEALHQPPAPLVLFHFVRNLFRYLLFKYKLRFTKQRFTLLYSREDFHSFDISINNFRALPIPGNSFRADPFPVKKGDSVFVFFEDYPYSINKGHISVIEIKNDGSYAEPVVALEKPYHLSYPFIFEYEGSYYMIPETAENKTVELYKCISFPGHWELAAILMKDIVLIDATLLHHNNKWWLFGTTNTHETTSTNDQLLIFYSDSLFSGKWEPHAQNPVVTDIANCRPAGKIFLFNGKLYRPAQNNASKQYGYAVQLNEIGVLNETSYSEREVKAFIPGKENGLKAIHTFNFTDGFVVIDGILAS